MRADSFIKANDPSKFDRVIEAAKAAGLYGPLINYLAMCRRSGVKDSLIDGALVYAYAKTDRLGDLDEFISNPNLADVCCATELARVAR